VAYILRSNLPQGDAFRVALRNGFKQADVSLEENRALPSADDRIVQLELQPDKVTVLVRLPLGDAGQEFLEENPDMVEIAVRDSLRRYLKRQALP
jgi:hypothetical protein